MIVSKTFNELNNEDLYQILRLRSEVFVVEQDCVYQDIDGKDQKAKHVLGKKENDIVAYARIFKPGDYFKEASFGRAVVKKTERGKGVGDELVKNCLEIITEEEIKISAQSYLKGFYGKHGFKSEGKEYLEDGIPHTAMFIR